VVVEKPQLIGHDLLKEQIVLEMIDIEESTPRSQRSHRNLQ
jgi:hypothetical protein